MACGSVPRRGGVEPLPKTNGVAVAPDQKSLYVVGNDDGTVAGFHMPVVTVKHKGRMARSWQYPHPFARHGQRAVRTAASWTRRHRAGAVLLHHRPAERGAVHEWCVWCRRLEIRYRSPPMHPG